MPHAAPAGPAGGMDHLSRRDFDRLARFIHGYSGIKVPPAKKTMVEGRLRRRVAANRFPSLTDYCRFLFEEDGLEAETVHLIDVITTNKTDFFREPNHFQFLAETAVPQLLAANPVDGDNVIRVWSTASSIGAEPYTLAMVLHAASDELRRFRFSILATDLSTQVLQTAVQAIYPQALIAPVPMDMRRRYLLRSRNAARDVVRIAPEIRRLVRFGRLNLMDEDYPVEQGLDIIFCRNILIYFDKRTQQSVLSKLCGHLRPGGFLFLGHSESLAGPQLPLSPVGPTVFRRD
ncbi:MAG TPA: CheR family methyltransferase [Acetobacteraceae bacterium]|nr:CheR family methyltransferase [Acetobacteraceae bacterium]